MKKNEIEAGCLKLWSTFPHVCINHIDVANTLILLPQFSDAGNVTRQAEKNEFISEKISEKLSYWSTKVGQFEGRRNLSAAYKLSFSGLGMMLRNCVFHPFKLAQLAQVHARARKTPAAPWCLPLDEPSSLHIYTRPRFDIFVGRWRLGQLPTNSPHFPLTPVLNITLKPVFLSYEGQPKWTHVTQMSPLC